MLFHGDDEPLSTLTTASCFSTLSTSRLLGGGWLAGDEPLLDGGDEPLLDGDHEPLLDGDHEPLSALTTSRYRP